MTLAVLSWAAHKTLTNTLESYRRFGLDQLDDDKVIFFQEITKEDRAIAKEFGYDCFGSPDNIGIAEAYKLLVAYASGDLFLFLENDWELIEDPKEQLWQARHLLTGDSGKYPPMIDVARLRHRKNPGAPLWSRQYEGNEYLAPQYLLDSVYWRDNPEELDRIAKIENWYLALAENANWTNNPTLCRTEFLREYVVPYISDDIEKSFQAEWSTRIHIVGQSEGLFTHNRIDR